MQYLITFLEGALTFISPCMLPMLPLYIAYFAGGTEEDRSRHKTLNNAIGFVIGFTIVFVLLGAFAGSLGAALDRSRVFVNILSGLLVIFFGLNFLGWLPFHFLDRSLKVENKIVPGTFFSSILFGMVFSIGWTPCVGAFLGSALLLASQHGSATIGVGMLFAFSLGLGIPFIFCAIMLERLRGAFDFIKNNYALINRISGILLILMGALMITGRLSLFFASFANG